MCWRLNVGKVSHLFSSGVFAPQVPGVGTLDWELLQGWNLNTQVLTVVSQVAQKHTATQTHPQVPRRTGHGDGWEETRRWREREREKERERERDKERKKERENKRRERERKREKWFGEPWYSAAGYGWYGSYGSWYGRRRGSWGGKSEVRSDVEWLCQKCGCASVVCDDVDIPQSSTQEKLLSWRRRWLYGRRRAYLELEKLQKKLNGPKKTAKHIEAKQNWINRESKRLEAETARLTELQESLRVRKETLKVAYEEIKILREDLLTEGETMDKNMSHLLSPEDTEEIRRLEQQELAFWRGSALKILAAWTRDGSSEEIAGWMLEAQRFNKEVEAKKRKLQETIERESRKDARMGDDAMDGLDGSLSS